MWYPWWWGRIRGKRQKERDWKVGHQEYWERNLLITSKSVAQCIASLLTFGIKSGIHFRLSCHKLPNQKVTIWHTCKAKNHSLLCAHCKTHSNSISERNEEELKHYAFPTIILLQIHYWSKLNNCFVCLSVCLLIETGLSNIVEKKIVTYIF